MIYFIAVDALDETKQNEHSAIILAADWTW